MSTTTMTPFQSELAREVLRIRRSCQNDGTTALGFDSLFAALCWRNLPSAPRGTNAVYFIKQDLRFLVESNHGLKAFVLP